MKKYADSHNYEIVEMIREVCSEASLNRPSSNIYAVMAKNISRFGRCSHSELSNFINSLEEKGVQVLTMDEGNLSNIPFLKVAY